MKSGIKVGDVMTRNFVSVSPDANLIECSREMTKKRVGSLILISGKRLVGLLTEKDIIWAIGKAGNNLHNVKAKDIASKKIAVIKPGADIYEALQRMKKLKFRRLPVVVNGDVIGMLTLKDILRVEPAFSGNLNHFEMIRGESEKLKKLKGEKWIKEGMCEECGNFDVLYKVDERLLCDPCRSGM